MQIYEHNYHCFGCGAHGPLAALENTNYYKFVQRSNNYYGNRKENIAEKMALIKNLPTKQIRGFELPYDSQGYYIVYPDSKYYVKRLWEGNSTNKYRSPMGHRKPLYKCLDQQFSKTLWVIEGQLNALTFDKFLQTEDDVISPGAATDFTRVDFVDYYAKYDTIIFVVDADAAGVINAMKAKDKLLPLKKKVYIHPVENDLNDIYVNQGEKAAEKEVSQIVALYQV